MVDLFGIVEQALRQSAPAVALEVQSIRHVLVAQNIAVVLAYPSL